MDKSPAIIFDYGNGNRAWVGQTPLELALYHAELNSGGNVTEACRRIGCCRTIFYMWRKGKYKPSRVNLLKIAKAAGIKVEWLESS